MATLNLTKFFSVLVVMMIVLSGCIYKLEVQQGNLIEASALDSLSVGMNPRQVLYLLGNPVLNDPLQNNQWTYVFYETDIDAKAFESQTVIIYFENDVVARIENSAINP
jgi:outer membrane protein assembly factor BamE